MKIRSETEREPGTMLTQTFPVSVIEHRVMLFAYAAQFKTLQPALDRGPMLAPSGTLLGGAK